MSDSTLEVIAQQALDIFRAISQKQKSGTIYVYCAVPELVSAGMSHYNADRAYAHLKRLGLVRSVQKVKGNRYYYLEISPAGTVDEKIAERRAQNAQNAATRRKLTRRVILEQQITECKSRLDELQKQLLALDQTPVHTDSLPTE